MGVKMLHGTAANPRYDPGMSKRILLPVIALALLLPASGAQPGAPSGDDAWKRLIALAGEWEGTEGGRTATLTYTVISGGSALMESMQMPAPEPDMVTIYHRDGAGLVATHYCSMGNQPRMRAGGLAADGKSIQFRFADITNLSKPGGGHIQHLTVKFIDQGHLTQEWTSVENGKEQAATFHWTRKK
jgi:hypothetical protein